MAVGNAFEGMCVRREEKDRLDAGSTPAWSTTSCLHQATCDGPDRFRQSEKYLHGAARQAADVKQCNSINANDDVYALAA